MLCFWKKYKFWVLSRINNDNIIFICNQSDRCSYHILSKNITVVYYLAFSEIKLYYESLPLLYEMFLTLKYEIHSLKYCDI